MTHGSLFSGIGGFDLAAEWMGWENAFHCEWNPFGQRVLKYYWPNAISYDDITKTDFTIWKGRIDVLSGGFPCQPYSLAGKRLGTEDERHLWPEMLRAIREIQPRYIVGENVSGLINWNAGMVFENVQAEMEAEGYEVLAFVLPAAGVGAEHKRERASEPSTNGSGFGFLPTPVASDFRDRGGPSNPSIQRRMKIGKSIELSMLCDGKPDPRLPLQMMGFPTNWTELPFQIGRKNHGEEPETQ